MRPVIGAISVFLTLTGACMPYQVFPPNALDGVDPNFDFSHWHTLPNQPERHKIQLGGRIVQSNTKDDAVTIVAIQLPIVEHPIYGPRDMGKPSGRFTILYQGRIDPLYLHVGNHIIAVGYTRPPTKVEIDNIPRSFPTMTAQCIHFWNTGGIAIEDFRSSGAGYATLMEETYCEASL
jgi:starvation-inducible outer membrane lipoprotein